MKRTICALAFTLLGLASCGDKDPNNADLIRTYYTTPNPGGKATEFTYDYEIEKGYPKAHFIVLEERDRDQNKKRELVIEYQGKRQYIKLDKDGNLYLEPYTPLVQAEQ